MNFGVRGICCCLILALNAAAQQQETIPTSLNVVVVEGEGVMAAAGQRVSPEPKIRVIDQNQNPVAGAAVVFTLPTEGATGEFGNRQKTLIVNTDKAGLATAQGLRMNNVAGLSSIHVTASYKGLSALAIISLENRLPPGVKPQAAQKHGHGALIAVLIVVAGAAAGGAVYATQRNSGSSSNSTAPPPPTPIGITPGTGVIVGGH